MRIIEFIGAKGGQGTSVTAASFAMVQAEHRPTHLLAAPGDDPEMAVVCGHPGFGSAEGWASFATNLTWGANVPPETEVVITDRKIRLEECIRLGVEQAQVERVLVMRNCYLAVWHVLHDVPHFDWCVLILEPGRSLTAADIEDVLGRSVTVTLPFDPAIARVIDAGLLTSRPPRITTRAFARAEIPTKEPRS